MFHRFDGDLAAIDARRAATLRASRLSGSVTGESKAKMKAE